MTTGSFGPLRRRDPECGDPAWSIQISHSETVLRFGRSSPKNRRPPAEPRYWFQVYAGGMDDEDLARLVALRSQTSPPPADSPP